MEKDRELSEEEVKELKKETEAIVAEEKRIKTLTKKEMQKQFNMFKKRFKVRSKGELIAIIWEQGMEFRKLQDIAQELYEENKTLKEPQENSND